MHQQPPLLSLDDAANLLKVGVPTIQSLINRGLLAAQDDGRIAYADVLAFLRHDEQVLRELGHHPSDLGLLGE